MPVDNTKLNIATVTQKRYGKLSKSNSAVTGIKNLYSLVIEFNGREVYVQTPDLLELTITCSLNSFLPKVKMNIPAMDGYLMQTVPFDQTTGLTITFDRLGSIDTTIEFDFDIYRRFPDSENFEVSGLLNVPNLFRPLRTRGWYDTCENILKYIAYNDLKLIKTELSAGLDTQKKILQPNITNADLFEYLRNNISNTAKDGNFYCYIKQEHLNQTLVFKSLADFHRSGAKKILHYGAEVNNEEVGTEFKASNLSAWGIKVIDNYKLKQLKGVQKLDTEYFDYAASTYKKTEVLNEEYPSLTDHFSIRKDDAANGSFELRPGRSNEFTSDFSEVTKSNLYKNITGLVKLQVSTYGQEDIYPGDLIQLFFPNTRAANKILTNQYEGMWMVETVEHQFGDMYITQLLLTRGGLDIIEDTSLIKAEKRKK